MSKYNVSYEIEEDEHRTDSEWNGTLMMLFWDISNRVERLDECNAMHLLEDGEKMIGIMEKAKRHRDNFQFKRAVRTLKKVWRKTEDAVKELDRKIEAGEITEKEEEKSWFDWLFGWKI